MVTAKRTNKKMGVKTVIVKQIMPADGWWAVFTNEVGGVYIRKVVCWGVISLSDRVPENYDSVVGIVDVTTCFLDSLPMLAYGTSQIPFGENASNFKYFIYASNEVEAFGKAVRGVEGDRKEGIVI